MADDLVLHGGDESRGGAAGGQGHLRDDAGQQGCPTAAKLDRNGQGQIAAVAQGSHILGRQRPGPIGRFGPRADFGRQPARQLHNFGVNF